MRQIAELIPVLACRCVLPNKRKSTLQFDSLLGEHQTPAPSQRHSNYPKDTPYAA
jgi:hypothetical protein